MMSRLPSRQLCLGVLAVAGVLVLGACADEQESLPPMTVGESFEAPAYRIGPHDSLQIFVWRSPELSTQVPVRPDGRISMPLLEDVQASGRTPTELSREIEKQLSEFVQNPLVTVMVMGFVGTFEQQVRVVGQAQQPAAIPYRANMTVLDVMIAVGGLTAFADGNRATIIRVVGGELKQFRVRLDDLLKEGEIEANVAMLPGDVIIIPETFF